MNLDDLDAVLFDIGGTLVVEAAPGTPVADLTVQLFPGVLDALTSLRRRVRVGAVTNTAVMTEADVRHVLVPSGLSDCLEVLVTSVDAGAAKPDPRALHLALDRLGLTDPGRVLFVGNDPVDQQAAARAGTDFAWSDGTVPLATLLSLDL